MSTSTYSNRPSLQWGQTITASDRLEYRVEEFIGRGGQGDVYRVIGQDGEYALKWYHTDSFLDKINKEAFYKNIVRNVKNGKPHLMAGDEATQFLWPEKLVDWQLDSFGYLMPLFKSGYYSLSDIIMGRHREKDGSETPLIWRSWFVRVTAALNIARAFEILHMSGLSYQDLNEGGFAINVENGDVMICDCDNVSPDQTNLGILGVLNYMAPEVARHEKLPDHYTDQYSMAIILFRLFFHNHPMEGIESISLHSSEKIGRREADMNIYGLNPHYCLDRKNPVNLPDKRRHSDVRQLCCVYPASLLQAFERVFTEGITDPMTRLSATEWRKVLLQVRDCLVQVDGREEFFYTLIDKEIPSSCRKLVYPNGRIVLCMPNKLLYSCHFNQFGTDFKTPVAKIIETKKPGILGLYNDSEKTIEAETEDTVLYYERKERIPLLPGMKLRIGTTTISVE